MNGGIGLNASALPYEVSSFYKVTNGVGYPDFTVGLHGSAFGRRQLPREAWLQGFDAQRVDEIFCFKLKHRKLRVDGLKKDQAQGKEDGSFHDD